MPDPVYSQEWKANGFSGLVNTTAPMTSMFD